MWWFETTVPAALLVLTDGFIPPDEAAALIVAFCDKHHKTAGAPGLDAWLSAFWREMLALVQDDEHNTPGTHERVLDILDHIKARARQQPADPGWRVWKKCGVSWETLPLFGAAVHQALIRGPIVYLDGKEISPWTREEAFLLAAEPPPDPDDSGSTVSSDARTQAFAQAGRHWLALNSFLARAWARGVWPGELLVLAAMRNAIEYLPWSPAFDLVPRGLAVLTAARWLSHGNATRMYNCRETLTDNAGRGGDLWAGPTGYNPARWSLWKRGLEQIARDGTERGHVRRTAKVALNEMLRAESGSPRSSSE
ncbi:hypothetical protein AURDEDRAFT_112813 [Auricularia subglabra TFB-10046 SS5]|nr:hypothetical protein AURDEDRAFT_112813 [Auricularia subglabra TFB-10046 SS5]